MRIPNPHSADLKLCHSICNLATALQPEGTTGAPLKRSGLNELPFVRAQLFMLFHRFGMCI